MQAIGPKLRRSEQLFAANLPVLRAIYINVILFLGLFGIGFLYIASGRYGVGPLRNTIVPSILVILGSLTVIGKKALTITAYDFYFVGFIALSFTSHIFANEYLYRRLGNTELEANLIYVLEVGVLFRAFFCLVSLAPRYASRFFLGSSLLVLSVVSLLGITQRFGPGKSLAVHIGAAISANSDQIVAAALNGRPSGVYSNPNLLGYAACVLAAFSLGWGFSNLANIKVWKTMTVLVLLAAAILCTVACQSRQSFALLAGAPFVFAFALRLKARDSMNFVAFGALLALGCFGLTLAVTGSKSTYLTSIGKTGIKHDESYQARTAEYEQLGLISGDIAAGGTGQSMSNENQFLAVSEHSRYNTVVIDSEWGNMFQAFGVWGPVLLALLYLFIARDTWEVWRLATPEAKLIASISLVLLAINLLLTATAVRVSKFDTSGFTFELLGALAAWKLVGIESGAIPVGLASRKSAA
jgi:hypothetical protein